jgi:aerobic carbon-monoxide dehydrogenase small subunit
MLSLIVNGKRRTYAGHPFKRLIDVLREDFRLTGAKEGCGEGECGACTVLIDAEPVNACLIPVGAAAGKNVETVEGLGTPESLHPLQRLFLERGGTQCGICTPGMLLTAWSYIRSGGSGDADDIRRYMAGNLCRCTGYQHIVDCIREGVRLYKRKGCGARTNR